MAVAVANDRERPQDFDDLRALRLEAEPRDLEDARVALQLIQERGYQRGKLLLEELDRFVES